MGLLLADDAAAVAWGASFCKVAKSAWAAERFPAAKSFPNCWISCCNCCFWLWTLSVPSRSKRLLLEIPETDIQNLPFDQAAWQCPWNSPHGIDRLLRQNFSSAGLFSIYIRARTGSLHAEMVFRANPAPRTSKSMQ